MTSPFKDGIQFAWDSTSLTWALDCPRKYQYKMIEGWQPRKTSVHLLFGGWYATALEHYHKLRIAEDKTHDEASVIVVREALVATWEYDYCSYCGGTGENQEFADDSDDVIKDYKVACEACEGKGNTGSPWLSDHNSKTRENLIRTIVWYLEHFLDDPTEVVKLANGKPAVELSFKLPVDNDIVLCGHIDRLVDYVNNEYVMDQKTTGSTITPRYFKQFKPGVQMPLYSFAGKAIYKTPVKGVIIDAAQIAVGFTRFERGFVSYSDVELDEWYENMMFHIQAIQAMTIREFFPMNPTSCNKFAGCEFRDVCSVPKDLRVNFLKADFEQKPVWNPLEVR